MTFTEAVRLVEQSLMNIGMKDKFGEAFSEAEMLVKLDLHFNGAWSKLVESYSRGEATPGDVLTEGLSLASQLAQRVFGKKTIGTLIKLDQEAAS